MKIRLLLLVLLAFVSLLPSTAVSGEFDSAGVKIHYTVQGTGEPVILIHGLYASARLNWEVPGIVAALTNSFQVVAFDNRGHGLSDKPKAEGEYGEKMVDDVVRLMDHLHIKRARLVGYSLGGMITMKMLTLHPERVSFAVIGGMGWLQPGAPARFFEKASGQGVQLAPVACVHGMAKLAITETELKSIRPPVVLIVGELDPCRRLYVEPLRKVRPDWPVHVIPAEGHLLCVLNPEFKAQVKAALQQNGARRPIVPDHR